jgi:gliding motility-associated-like protein
MFRYLYSIINVSFLNTTRKLLFAVLMLLCHAYSYRIYATQSSSDRKPSDLVFAENKGQWGRGVQFRGDLVNGRLYVEDNAFVFLKWDGEAVEEAHHHGSKKPIKGHTSKMVFAGANKSAVWKPAERETYYRNYYIGNNPAYWATNVGMFKYLEAAEIYPGIAAAAYGSGDAFKYEFKLQSNADPARIAVRYEGVEGLRISKGELQYSTTIGKFTELAPFAYQVRDGRRIAVKCRYVLDAATQTVRFDFPSGYDKSMALVIDPSLVFASYTGSTADNFGYSATYDKDGNLYDAGSVFEFRNSGDPLSGSGSYPLVGPFQSTFNGGYMDIGISKFNSAGSTLLYSTYLGGVDVDEPSSLFVNDNEELYVLGSSSSNNFPVTSGAYDQLYNGGVSDIIITKFNAGGNALLASTYVGGSGRDGRNSSPVLMYNYADSSRGEIIIDSNSNVFVASNTYSGDFPVTGAAFQKSYAGGQDGVVLKLTSDLSQLTWASYLGGSDDDACYSVKEDLNGNLVVAGGTASADFPIAGTPLNPSYMGGMSDGFVAKINAAATAIMVSSFIGTDQYDQCHFVEIDPANEVYLVGQTLGNYTMTPGTYGTANTHQFLQKLDNDLISSQASTTFGSGTGRVNISITAFLVDKCFNIYVAGWGGNVNRYHNPQAGFTTGMPVTPDAIKSNTDGSDLYFIVFKRDFQSLLFGSFYGGNAPTGEHVDGGTCRFDKNGVIYSAVCAGCGRNSLFPTTPGAWSRTNNSLNCNLGALKIDLNLAGTSVEVDAEPRATGCVPLTVNFTSVLNNVQTVLWHFGDGGTSTLQNPVYTYNDTGVYDVMLVGTDPTSCNISDTAYLQVIVRDDSLVTNFLPDVNIDCINNTVSFQSVNAPTTAYQWNFGDNTTSTLSAVTHAYQNAGTYDVTLVVTDPTRCDLVDSFTSVIVIPATLNMDIQATDTNGCVPLTVGFNNNGTTPNTSFVWSFGDGDSSTLAAPVHLYDMAGSFDVRVFIFDSTSCNKVDSAFARITAIDSYADADFTVVRQFFECDSVLVTLSSSYTGEDSELWDFGDGTTSSANPVSHMYRGKVTDTIIHYIYDADKICKARDTAMMIISLEPLDISITIPDTGGCVPFDATFIGHTVLLSTDFFWNFGDNATAAGDTVQHTYNTTGIFTVQLIGADSNACVSNDTAFATVVVIDDRVTADFTITTLNNCDSLLSLQLDNTSTNALEYLWTFSDSTTDNTMSPAKQFSLPGTYTITLYATDTNRCHPRDTISKEVILLPNSNAVFELPDAECTNATVLLDNKSNTWSHAVWYVSDGDTFMRYAPYKVFDKAGTYTITLVITDTASCNVTDTLSREIVIYDHPIASFTHARDTYKFDTPVQFTNTSKHYNTSMWWFDDGDTSSETSPAHHYTTRIGWQDVCLLVYMDGVPCQDTACDSIFISFIPLIGVPNAFSPNGDGVNDLVKVEGKGITDIEFTIYNRWGEIVFRTHDATQGWDGIYKGKAQDMEVYAYYVNAGFIDGSRKELKGNITLLR